jgi:3',5'-cyclic AMP phosphodiesterase CpdA
MATGWLGADQLIRLGAALHALKNEGLFRVVLIHHPPVTSRDRSKQLLDAAAFLSTVAAQGAELILHGHEHVAMLNWLDGPQGRAAAVGVPSASGAPGFAKAAAGWNLYRIAGTAGAWQCEMISRAIAYDGSIAEITRADISPVNAR